MSWRYQDELAYAARLAETALSEVSANIAAGVLLQEPEMNGAMASHLASAFRAASINGIDWKCRHFKSSGKSEENLTGADLVISVKIDLPGYVAEKGMLIQNKRAEMNGSKEQQRLIGQIGKMQQLTNSSWIGVLSGTQIRFDKAEDVLARGGQFGRRTARIPPLSFFRDFMICKTGDHSLDAQKAMELYVLSNEAADLLEVEAKGDRIREMRQA